MELEFRFPNKGLAMAQTEFIYFDLGKVIFEFDHQIACRALAKQTGLTPERVFESVFESGLEERYETGLVNCQEFHREFCKANNVEIPQDDFLHSIGDVFEPNRKIFGLIGQLSSRNYPIGILSNTCPAHWNFVFKRYTILKHFFPTTILSFEVNSMKPDPVIYQRAIEQAKCPAQNCFFVDDKQENVDGAIKAGMDAVLYTSVRQLVDDLESRGVQINY